MSKPAQAQRSGNEVAWLGGHSEGRLTHTSAVRAPGGRGTQECNGVRAGGARDPAGCPCTRPQTWTTAPLRHPSPSMPCLRLTQRSALHVLLRGWGGTGYGAGSCPSPAPRAPGRAGREAPGAGGLAPLPRRGPGRARGRAGSVAARVTPPPGPVLGTWRGARSLFHCRWKLRTNVVLSANAWVGTREGPRPGIESASPEGAELGAGPVGTGHGDGGGSSVQGPVRAPLRTWGSLRAGVCGLAANLRQLAVNLLQPPAPEAYA